MERRKITKVEYVNLVEPLTYHKRDGSIHAVKKLGCNSHYVVERNGQCYVVFNPTGYQSSDGLLFAIKEKFDELEGEEIESGSNASETEGVSPAE